MAVVHVKLISKKDKEVFGDFIFEYEDLSYGSLKFFEAARFREMFTMGDDFDQLTIIFLKTGFGEGAKRAVRVPLYGFIAELSYSS